MSRKIESDSERRKVFYLLFKYIKNIKVGNPIFRKELLCYFNGSITEDPNIDYYIMRIINVRPQLIDEYLKCLMNNGCIRKIKRGMYLKIRETS